MSGPAPQNVTDRHTPTSARQRNASRLSRVPIGLALAGLVSMGAVVLSADQPAFDPGPRGGGAGAGDQIPGLSTDQIAFFDAGQDTFLEVDSVRGSVTPPTDAGLGPRFNLDSCAGCHAQPATGGSSPASNPQVGMANMKNTVPFFITPDGPVREARFKYNRDGTRDGGVHDIFTISGRADTPAGCDLDQPDFETEAGRRNLIFRIPTPLFGTGLMESLPDATILANIAANSAAKRALGISGRANRSGSDGTVTRFGWKAQQPTLLAFAGEAYNVEQGVTNELSPQEREQTPACLVNSTPESEAGFSGSAVGAASDIMKFAAFMRFLAPPTPAAPTASSNRGKATFADVGCAYCHTPALMTGPVSVAALANQRANLYSDVALHQMGPGLADDILQGGAAGDEFRTAPLWGLGKRIFFLHDGRARNLKEAITAHASAGNSGFGPSEANAVVQRYLALPEFKKQDLLNFLRSL